MNTDSIYRNTVLEARLLVRAVVKADVLLGILMNKAALAFPVMSASVIMNPETSQRCETGGESSQGAANYDTEVGSTDTQVSIPT